MSDSKDSSKWSKHLDYETADPLCSSHIPSLDGLRFIAALLVILYHAGLEFPCPDGVTFFFVLSGFLFAVLLYREYCRTGTINLRKFYLRRTIRILPAFYATILITIVIKFFTSNPIDYAHAISSSLFVGNYYNAAFNHPATGFSHFWSLGVEEQFYLIWPLAFLAFIKLNWRGLIAALLGVALIVCLYRIIVSLSYVEADAYLYNAFECRCDSLAIGCVVGLLTTSEQFRRIVPQFARTGFEPLLVIALLSVGNMQTNSFRQTLGFSIESWLLALLLLQLITLHHHPLWSWLNHKWTRFLGTLSYSAYLVHAIGTGLAEKLSLDSQFAQLSTDVIITFTLAAGLYYLVEKPSLKLKARWTSGNHHFSKNTIETPAPTVNQATA